MNRPDKLSHLETILYEIDAFRSSSSKLTPAEDWSNWASLECFLLHFRNLIEFFGRNKQGDDLTIFRPERFWPEGHKIPSQELEQLRMRGFVGKI
jgi:hypothetical protein